MHCSGCGKDIPFEGDVCPYCGRDNTANQQFVVLAFLFAVPAAVIGIWVFDSLIASVVGFIGGCILAFVASGKGKKTKPPEVSVVNTANPVSDASEEEGSGNNIKTELQQLKSLLDDELITAEEFEKKKAELLSRM